MASASIAVLIAASCTAALEDGLTFAWTTPIFKQQLVSPESEDLGIVSDAIIAAWLEASAEHAASARSDSQTVNDFFFDAQRRDFQSGAKHLLSRLNGTAGDLMQTWQASWLQLIHAYVEAAAGPDAAASIGGSNLQLFAWAGVHTACSAHSGHHHDEAAVSGTFYLSVPVGGGGDFFADDPRGPRAPFENRMMHQPRAGELLLFPPWVRHGVGRRGGNGACSEPAVYSRETLRIAISFNLGLRADGDQSRDEDGRQGHACASKARNEFGPSSSSLWEVLSDATVVRSLA